MNNTIVNIRVHWSTRDQYALSTVDFERRVQCYVVHSTKYGVCVCVYVRYKSCTYRTSVS